ncbi:MAG: ATP phosphoribosyltransferase regulatory subunit [Sulfitobacter sp.]
MPTRSETLTRANEVRRYFEQQGASVVEPPILQPAETLLDLYGEDIRARAYVTSDAVRGEQMLRPDFTVPVVQMHMAEGAEPARYTYAGEVFRRQEDDPTRSNEYVQVGYELFDRKDSASADAEVFALIHGALAGLNVKATIGDIGVLTAAVSGLQTTADRKAALMRHIWRPGRFRALLERFAGRMPVPASRTALLTGTVSNKAPLNGVRTQAEIDARIEALRADAAAPPISAEQVDQISMLLDIRAPMGLAITQLQTLAGQMPQIVPAVAGVAARETALRENGINTDALMFEASYGRTSMEYYDGFVFGFRALGRDNWPDVATGGRYDALTHRLGEGAEIPAVGGVMRPGLMLELEAGQ